MTVKPISDILMAYCPLCHDLIDGVIMEERRKVSFYPDGTWEQIWLPAEVLPLPRSWNAKCPKCHQNLYLMFKEANELFMANIKLSETIHEVVSMEPKVELLLSKKGG